MKLKTLKDLGAENDDRLVWKVLLKAEAVKWVKLIHKRKDKSEKYGWLEEDIGKLEWIKHFFNLTEDDLK